MTRRKDALATELMAEVAPVVQGRGTEGDTTDAGWGVVIDTIEIQDVRVLSSEVFDRLQAPYREKLALASLRAEEEVRREAARLEREATEAREDARRALLAREEARLEAERERVRVVAAHEDEVQRLRTEARLEQQRLEAEASVERSKLEAEAARRRGETEAAVVRMLREARDAVSEARLQELALTETLPRVAEAFADSFDQAVVTGGDLGFLSAGVGQVLATLQAFDVRLPNAKG